MTETSLKARQLLMARYLRNPGQHPAPAGVEARRLKIYENLVYNNIEGFISGGFPVLRALYRDADWHALIRAFIDQHSCHTPYFLEISQEFVHFVMQDYRLQDSDPPFLVELAHYEWIEMALDISEEVLPAAVVPQDVLATVVRLSPLARSLRYRYPVHQIGPAFRPQCEEATGPTYLVVYRNRADKVGFIEQNAATARLLELVSENKTGTARTLLATLAGELGLPEESVLAHGGDQLKRLIAESVVLVSTP